MTASAPASRAAASHRRVVSGAPAGSSTLPTRMFSRAVNWYWAKSWKITLIPRRRSHDVVGRAGRAPSSVMLPAVGS